MVTVTDAWIYVLTDSGREIDNVESGEYATEEDAIAAGHAALDDMCPPGTVLRRFYRVEAREKTQQ